MCLRVEGAVIVLRLTREVVENLKEAVFGIILARVQVEVRRRIDSPFPLQLLHGKPLEQLALAAEVGWHGRHRRRLAQPTRTAQKVMASLVGLPVDECGLDDIDITFVVDLCGGRQEKRKTQKL